MGTPDESAFKVTGGRNRVIFRDVETLGTVIHWKSREEETMKIIRSWTLPVKLIGALLLLCSAAAFADGTEPARG